MNVLIEKITKLKFFSFFKVSEPSSLVRAMNAIMTKKISIEDALLHFNVSKKALRGAFFSKMVSQLFFLYRTNVYTSIFFFKVMKSDVKDPNLVHAVDLYLNHLWSSKRVYIKTGVTRSMLEDAIERKSLRNLNNSRNGFNVVLIFF